ncbi:uncharacterized protein LOC124437303 [Xenia sp. Carnegie-2017]|uniref:uncharacterized protein LOC124437303 n=1 Tax=Xenia sp. Carnegie-2017 TaxID=2897299 RepID=UPI001F045A53|nr:uncharacterized protein LOC124437303 [Xenia sp. Carnegie-2017]
MSKLRKFTVVGIGGNVLKVDYHNLRMQLSVVQQKALMIQLNVYSVLRQNGIRCKHFANDVFKIVLKKEQKKCVHTDAPKEKEAIIDPFIGISTEKHPRFIQNRRDYDINDCKVHGFVFEAKEKYNKTFDEFFDLVKKGTGSVQAVVLVTHANAICHNLFGGKKADHFHMLVYYNAGKFTDSNANRIWSKFKIEKGVEWNSQMIIKPQSMEAYVQCEVRLVAAVFGDKQILERLRHANKPEVKAIMQQRIDDRDDDRKRKRKDDKYGDDDWWVSVAHKNAGELQSLITSLGIRDVSKFLSYAARFMPEYKFDGFIYDPRRAVIENQINEEIKRVYRSWDWWECFNSRKSQFEAAIKRGATKDVDDSIECLQRILRQNGIRVKHFVRDVFKIVLKQEQKKNCLFLYGKSNTFKSTISRSIVNMVPMIGQQITSREFAFQECLEVNVIFSEETKITPDIVQSVKQVYEGTDHLVNRKGKSGILMERTPVICCSNYHPAQYVPDEEQTLLNRMHFYRFSVHDSLKDIKGEFTPLMWEELYNMYLKPKTPEPIFY